MEEDLSQNHLTLNSIIQLVQILMERVTFDISLQLMTMYIKFVQLLIQVSLQEIPIYRIMDLNLGLDIQVPVQWEPICI